MATLFHFHGELYVLMWLSKPNDAADVKDVGGTSHHGGLTVLQQMAFHVFRISLCYGGRAWQRTACGGEHYPSAHILSYKQEVQGVNWEVVRLLEPSKPAPNDVLPAAMLYLLNFPTQRRQLRNKCPNVPGRAS